MEKVLHLISSLPKELQIIISEYNAEHRKQMKWVLQDLSNKTHCDTCKKIIIKYVYSERNCDMNCCSLNCVDNYTGHSFYNNYNGYNDY